MQRERDDHGGEPVDQGEQARDANRHGHADEETRPGELDATDARVACGHPDDGVERPDISGGEREVLRVVEGVAKVDGMQDQGAEGEEASSRSAEETPASPGADPSQERAGEDAEVPGDEPTPGPMVDEPGTEDVEGAAVQEVRAVGERLPVAAPGGVVVEDRLSVVNVEQLIPGHRKLNSRICAPTTSRT